MLLSKIVVSKTHTHSMQGVERATRVNAQISY
jgi:hypothetical protein